MIVLSLDQALATTGWCVWLDNSPIAYGTIQTKKSVSIEKRLGEIWQHLLDLKYEYDFNFIVLEDVQQQASPKTYSVLSMVKATVLLFCYFNDIKYKEYPASTWRRINGGGYGKKREEQKQCAINNVKKWYNVEVESDIADAINIGRAYIQDRKNAFEEK